MKIQMTGSQTSCRVLAQPQKQAQKLEREQDCASLPCLCQTHGRPAKTAKEEVHHGTGNHIASK